ncbi:phosphoribosylglycinamide formyltransferase-1 [Pigmentiphaga litoralis]|uniref:Phosphoribosylglycinamide formyltransferase n=1 Tax=Pigmentiphaga litoralis TaxID=516702 RepID=A0A7Y9IZP4_9BURK|nr:phosphoribosylglycinamide formyltransferase-1 [Pigmentiphaga litoralis]NYE85795.1 phosphoribosylglycinamide formyltransferase-1 [Pigmentiphaga litoralis]
MILISGRGSNLQAIADACHVRELPAQVVGVIANRASASGLEWAASRGIPTRVVSHQGHADRASFDAALAQEIDALAPDYVLLAGFMRILTDGFVNHYAGRLINIHPSLLPLFPGLATHQQALDAGVQVHGCTVHVVTPELDHGPIIAQGIVPVQAGDTPDSLSARVLQVEHQVYPAVAQWLAEGRVQIHGDQVSVTGVSRRLFEGGVATPTASAPAPAAPLTAAALACTAAPAALPGHVVASSADIPHLPVATSATLRETV